LNQKTILICPLDWGLGHASRMVPVINELLLQGCVVHIAASGSPLKFVRSRFGNRLTYHEFSGRKITYPKGSAFFPKFIIELPFLLYSIYKEHRYLKKLVTKIHPDLIISDNRYGAWHPGIKSVFVTHQLFIRLPKVIRFLRPLVNFMNHWFISRFDVCWVPDYGMAPGLSGALSHGNVIKNIRYIGPLSRFENMEVSSIPQFSEKMRSGFLLAIISGPEPQRTLFEKHLENELRTHHIVFFRGIPGSNYSRAEGNYTWYDDPSDTLVKECIERCEVVICRSGYTSIMDLSVFGKKVIFVPTPGQTEQEYLAEMYERCKYAINLPQSEIGRLKDSIWAAKNLKGLPVMKNEGLLRKAIFDLIPTPNNNQQGQ
jgi:uncharacterized protein (TIGR00661 family)